MGKIVKYCSSCDEGFSEKFSFCPNCSASLQAFEMNPVTGATTAVEEAAPAAPAFIAETPAETNGQTETTNAAFDSADENAVETADENVDLEYDDSKYDYLNVNDEKPAHAAAFTATPAVDDDDYHITVIEETNGGQRNGLLLASTIFMVLFVCGATVYSLFNKALDVGSISEGSSLAYLIDEVPMPVEEEKQQKKDKDAGGGGGGGREEKDPASQGDLADQTKNPIRPPDAHIPRLDNPALTLPPPSTEGNKTFEKKYNKWGVPNGLDGLTSNGTGSGDGLGNGYGTGQGSGTGTGAGTGNGSGYGGGNGNGNGNGNGGGDSDDAPKSIVKETTPFRLIAKPKATYTDQARTNNVQGSVSLKVTLMANGSVGSITPLTRLPYGLTEQAIAAARLIKFEPKKINGVPVSTIVTFQYSFNIY